MTLSWIGCFVLFKCSTKERIPPSYAKSCFFSLRSSWIEMPTPGFRNESSRSRCDSPSKWNSCTEKTSGSGQNVIFVPVLRDVPTALIGPCGTPCS